VVLNHIVSSLIGCLSVAFCNSRNLFMQRQCQLVNISENGPWREDSDDLVLESVKNADGN